MSATGLDVFDKTLQTTNSWLDEISQTLGPDRKLAWKVLSIVLHKLRDRIPVDLSAHLGAELPLLVRGTYYDQPDREGAARVARGRARVVALGRGKRGPTARARGTRPLSSLKPCTFRAGSNPTRSLTRAG